MSNYPAGAEHDSRAPYNWTGEHSHLCRLCDADEIRRDVEGRYLDDDWDEVEIDNEVEQALDSAGMCTQCLEEQRADLMEDDYD